KEKIFKRFYTESLRDLYAIKHRAIILNQLVDIVTLYTHLRGNDKYRDSMIALEKFINDARAYFNELSNLKLYTLIEYAYSAIAILLKYGIMVFCVPSYDVLRPWKWTLLLHELGHAAFIVRKDDFIKKFRDKILPILRELAPTSLKEEGVARYLRTWEQNWLKELISDLYGVAIGGPAYTYTFMIEVFEDNPARYAFTHPSLDSRIYVQLKCLEKMELGKLVSGVKELWFTHRSNVLVRELGYPFPQKVLEELVSVFLDMVGRLVFPDISDKVVELRLQLNQGRVPAGTPLFLILALALSDNRRNRAIQGKVLEAIVADQ
ncbi:MAG: hypothetical protein DRN15_06855, partial [Thermoprotei archaeon]